MTTLFVLDYLTFDATHSTEKEFEDKASVYAWLLGQRESDFHYITLFHGDNEPVDGWSDVIEFCRPIKPLTDLSVCGDACNCMKCSEATIERSEMVNPSKSSCIALSEPEHSMEGSEWVIDPFDAYEPGELPPAPVGTVTFGELEDGAEFYIAMTWAYGSRNKLQKVMEDGEHNAVWCSATHIGELIPDGIRVVRA